MTNNILVLILIVVALAVLHIPSIVTTLAGIGGLSFLAIKMFWNMMQLFSSSANAERSATST